MYIFFVSNYLCISFSPEFPYFFFETYHKNFEIFLNFTNSVSFSEILTVASIKLCSIFSKIILNIFYSTFANFVFWFQFENSLKSEAFKFTLFAHPLRMILRQLSEGHRCYDSN
ncbi:Serpentine Receptor, class BC (Class B-like) [Caenorhabditis elegans]|uniref:Serpentine Receptor, class BC (Class B-like) n=1 Tax=Caenorhabditis elegans TaxID=6239 RepID=Q94274_CAEEL|nr:Serpentine Receptor, class BC (Class B-like) [Caenorhabditis elegans]CCD72630.1 Serpentine Receptor, class BC (Class B-like) [Caenorhabditis elegans]|eukprot:NP_509085.2 Uncharacterized protein CELE_K10C2.6 [Caenorhabditis elegans]